VISSCHQGKVLVVCHLLNTTSTLMTTKAVYRIRSIRRRSH